MKQRNLYRYKRKWLLLIIVVIVPLGFLAKHIPSGTNSIMANRVAGLLYVVFWSLIASVVFIQANKLKIVLFVFGITCALEFIQLYSCPFLETIRSTYLGRTIIGTSFTKADFIYYFLGAILAYIIFTLLEKRLLRIR